MTFNLNYTYSHAIDEGSTWHSGATSSNGPAAGEGYTTDVTQPALDRGNSIFDVRQRLVGNYVLELPWYRSQQGIIGHILGGWSNVGVISWQTGAHWEPFRASSRKLVDAAGNTCTAADVNSGNCTNLGGDYNLDGVANDRPNSNVSGFSGATHDQWADGFFLAPSPPTSCSRLLAWAARVIWVATPSLVPASWDGILQSTRRSRSLNG